MILEITLFLCGLFLICFTVWCFCYAWEKYGVKWLDKRKRKREREESHANELRCALELQATSAEEDRRERDAMLMQVGQPLSYLEKLQFDLSTV